MKKEYIAPVVEFDELETSNIMAGSVRNPSFSVTDPYIDQPEGSGNQEEDGSEESLSKGMGSFAFAEDFEYSIDM